MLIDSYTKFILTIIAGTLVALTFNQFVTNANADTSCGESYDKPCVMVIVGDGGRNSGVDVEDGRLLVFTD
ncbi:hypothetical protein [Pararhizobium sp. IMCC21322]|uniref:hypothetical protein n=1 Tax=Pararhizobium sp. IMCC21322 TaxID=3067903 RepID=UPI002740A654|nr:hypothetical protein [Pararhizobium sp. IMCC21322]